MNTIFGYLKPAFIQGGRSWNFDPNDIRYVTFGLVDNQDNFVMSLVLEWHANGELKYCEEAPEQKDFLPLWSMVISVVMASSGISEIELVNALVEYGFEDITLHQQSDARANLLKKLAAAQIDCRLILQELAELDLEK